MVPVSEEELLRECAHVLPAIVGPSAGALLGDEQMIGAEVRGRQSDEDDHGIVISDGLRCLVFRK